MEHESFEVQIQEIDTELTKFDRRGEVSQATEFQEFDSHPKTDPNNLVIGETIGDL